jgi:hypothetical protein
MWLIIEQHEKSLPVRSSSDACPVCEMVCSVLGLGRPYDNVVLLQMVVWTTILLKTAQE